MSKIHTSRQFAFPTTYYNVDGNPDKSATVPGLRKVEIAAIEIAAQIAAITDDEGQFLLTPEEVADRSLYCGEALCDLIDSEYEGFRTDS